MAGEEDELDAAERALGTLPPGAGGLEGQRQQRAWEMRLAPLAGLLQPVPPPGRLLDRILSRIESEEAARQLRAERRRASRWRTAAVSLAAAAAAVAIVAFVQPRDGGPELVSVATGEDGAPALVITLDVEDGLATVRPVALQAAGDRSLELWHIRPGSAPVSLGLLDPAEPRQVQLAALAGDLAAVSLEPAGGSPTGQPTGPVLYSGPFLALR